LRAGLGRHLPYVHVAILPGDVGSERRVRRWAECHAGGELPLELSDPELRLDNIVQFPITGPYHGHEVLRRWWQDVAEASEEIRFEAEELIDLDDQNQALKAAALRE
jgi:hypothetical protein